jgi:hypothetical protein
VLRVAVIVSPKRFDSEKAIFENFSEPPSASIRNEAGSPNRPQMLGTRLSVSHPCETYETVSSSVEFAHDAERRPGIVN